uniref:Exonuclease family protein n=1 Tax=Babesia bovis TaxID=5865 RepID=A7ANV7_BABBO|eukprot:XP_001611809.1 exonuclease family protein [Babesia bovis T2Bo]
MTTCTDSGDVPAYTLQPLLQHRSAPIEWKQFQLFLSWLMSNAARTKCPLNLRQGRPRSHHNVLVAVPYLDADYLMDDLDALSIIFRGTQGSNLNRLCNPRISDDSVSCNIIKRLLLMEKINTDSVPRSIRAFTLGRAELRHTEGWDFIFENAIITPSDSSTAVSNIVTESVTEEQFFAILMANVTRSRRICKNRDELTEDIEHYIASEFTSILDSTCKDDDYTQSNDIEKAENSSNTQEATGSHNIPSHFDKELIRKYAATAYKLKDDCDFGRTFAIDCEMVTAGGVTALARITIVDSLLNTVFDALVKPEGDIQDYRTPYSGITAESLEDVTIRLSDIQECLNMLIGPDTILVGHSLDNDLKACEIAHFNVLDTALQYIAPRRHNKPSLKSLVKQHIGIELVRDSGHDSYVDASTTMFLAMEGVMTLTPGVRTLVDILDPRACGLMEDAEILSTSQVHLYDPMASDYQSVSNGAIIHNQ